MKKNAILITLAAATAAFSCAKEEDNSIVRNESLVFEAWVQHNKELYPEYLWRKTELGCYILEDIPGTGSELADSGYVSFEYTTRTLNGTITSSSRESVLRQKGSYRRQIYTGPMIYQRENDALFVGLEEAIKGMKIGGSRKVAIPGWLLASARYGSIDEYKSKNTGKTSIIYELTLCEAFNSVNDHEIAQIQKYVKEHLPDADTITYGLWFKRLGAPTSDKEIPNDSTVYINYSGRLLGGHLFDTNIKRLAQDTYLEDFQKTRNYSPAAVTWAEKYSDIKLSGNTVIEGFSRILKNMHPGEKAVGVFWSQMGYSAQGSDAGDGENYSIPPFSPLVFEIELVPKP